MFGRNTRYLFSELAKINAISFSTSATKIPKLPNVTALPHPLVTGDKVRIEAYKASLIKDADLLTKYGKITPTTFQSLNVICSEFNKLEQYQQNNGTVQCSEDEVISSCFQKKR